MTERELIAAEHQGNPPCWACDFPTVWIGTGWKCLDVTCQQEAPPDVPEYAAPDGTVHNCTENGQWCARTVADDMGAVQGELSCSVCRAILYRGMRYIGTWLPVEVAA